MEITELKSNNVKTTLIKTDKFKTITIQVVFLGEFSKETATKRSLLTRVMSASTKVYPTKKAIANKLYSLYDASIGISTYPTYKTSVTVFTLDIVNQKNIKNAKDLTKEAIKLLKEFIFNPNINQGAFDEKVFNEQKRILRENINNIYNNKTRYALRKTLKLMAEDEIISVSALGALEDLEKITASNLYETYQKMIKDENVSIFVVGDFDNQQMLNDLKILGDFPDNLVQTEVVSKETKQITKVREFVEKQSINQTKLIMGFRTNINTMSELYVPSLLFNAMFGGLFSSDLVRVVREENSLAYTIASQTIHDIKILIVSAGIDQDKYHLASDLVIKQLELYKQGVMSLDNLTTAKEVLINELIEIEDSPFMLINFYLRNYLYQTKYRNDDLIQEIKEVTLDQVQAVAQGVNLDTIFLLTSEDYHG